MSIRKAMLVMGIGAIGAAIAFAVPASAGTCQLVTAKAFAKDAATATTRAQAKLVEKAARKGGKLMNTSTSCKASPLGAECKMEGSLCP